MIIPSKCPYCDFMFFNKPLTESDLQFEKYEHLMSHNEFKTKINEIISHYPSIKKYIKIKPDAKFNKNRNTHQFIQVLWNHTNNQYSYLLKKFDNLLKKYGTLLEDVQKNIVLNKTLSDFFAFYSELEVMENLGIVFKENPKIFKADNNKNVDFILDKNKLIVEVKTPLESKLRLFDYIQEWKQQKQLKEMSEKYPNYYKILIINSKHRYLDFGNIGGFRNFLSNKKLFWNCCIAYNNFNNNGDIMIIKDFANEKRLLKLKDKLIGDIPKSFILEGIQNDKNQQT